MEQHRQYTIVLTAKGMFEKAVPITDADIGAEVAYEPLSRRRSIRGKVIHTRKQAGVLAIACVLLLLLFPVYFIADTSRTYAYVNVDINPSLELAVDKKLKIHSVKPLNTDAKQLLQQMTDIEGKELAAGIEAIMQSSVEQHLLKNGKQMLIGVNQKEGKIKILNRLSQTLYSNVDWNIAAISIPDNVREMAQKKHASMNEIMAKQLLGDNQDHAGDKHTVQINEKERAIIKNIYKQPDKGKKDRTNTGVKTEKNKTSGSDNAARKTAQEETPKEKQKENVRHTPAKKPSNTNRHQSSGQKHGNKSNAHASQKANQGNQHKITKDRSNENKPRHQQARQQNKQHYQKPAKRGKSPAYRHGYKHKKQYRQYSKNNTYGRANAQRAHRENPKKPHGIPHNKKKHGNPGKAQWNPHKGKNHGHEAHGKQYRNNRGNYRH